jgi:hypothetical protein
MPERLHGTVFYKSQKVEVFSLLVLDIFQNNIIEKRERFSLFAAINNLSYDACCTFKLCTVH